MNRTQGHKEAAWALGLLPNDAVFERNPLVVDAGLKTAGTVAGQHCIAIAQTFAPLGGDVDFDV